MKRNPGRAFMMWILTIGITLLIFGQILSPRTAIQPVPVSNFIARAESGDFEMVVLDGPKLIGVLKGGKEGVSAYAADENIRRELVDVMVRNHVPFGEKEQSDFWGAFGTILNIGFMILLIVVVISIFSSMSRSAGGISAFGRSNAKKIAKDAKTGKTFADVAGIDEAVEDVRDIVDFLKNPKKFSRLGGRMPKGVLMVGPPGTGKTLLARAVAGEAGVPFFHISGSQFVEMFVGVGASRVRDLFEQAKKDAPCIIFIDEIDGVGGHRVASMAGGHDERGQTLNQLLVEMDGFEPNNGVIVVAATNKPEMLDAALVRPGRFDRTVVVPPPDIKGRDAILKVHSRKLRLAADVDLNAIARGTAGMTGAGLEELLNQAALNAARLEKAGVSQADLEWAKDRVLMGTERKSTVLSDREKQLTAYHECGHAIVGHFTKGADPVHKVTIIPRGMALGLTQSLPVEDRRSYTRDELLGLIKMLLGGRAAEKHVFGEGSVTTGASNDLERATELARRMACRWGMSRKLGPLVYGAPESAAGSAFGLPAPKEHSEAKAAEIDAEMHRIITECEDETRLLLVEKEDRLKAMALELIEKETLDAHDLERILGPRVV